jgi:trimethylamine--corrinoid protein Co-methyltransferase
MEKNSNISVRPRLCFLDPEGLKAIHLATLQILEETGVWIQHDGVVDMLASAGCKVIGPGHVTMPPQLVEDAVAKAASSITIYNRKGEPALFLEDRNSYWGTGSDTPFVLDTFSDERRQTVLKDVEQVARLVDALPNMDFLMCMGVAHELPQSIADKHHFVAMASNTIKPLVFTASSKENLDDIYHMACAIVGGEDVLRQKPFMLHYCEPIPPLMHPTDALEQLLYCVEKDLPVIYSAGTVAAQSGPATLAGTLAISNARILSGIVIGQLKRPGAKMVVTMHASSMDPRSAVDTYASPEHIICQAAARDLAGYYHLPTFGRAGCTDAKIVDQQAALEYAPEIHIQAIHGENLIHDVGYIESGLTSSCDAIVMANEIIGAAKRVARGFEINQETLALDLIKEIGPRGNFIAEPHTAKHFRKEFWFPELIDRDNFSGWEQKGRTTLLQRVKAKAHHILRTHQPEALDQGLAKNLQEWANKDNKNSDSHHTTG